MGYMRALNANDSLVPFDVPGFVGNYMKVDGFILPSFDGPGFDIPGFVATPWSRECFVVASEVQC